MKRTRKFRSAFLLSFLTFFLVAVGFSSWVIQDGESRPQSATVPVEADGVLDIRDCLTIGDVQPVRFSIAGFLNGSVGHLDIPLSIDRTLDGYDYVLQGRLNYQTSSPRMIALGEDGRYELSLQVNENQSYLSPVVWVYSSVDQSSVAMAEIPSFVFEATAEDGRYSIDISTDWTVPASEGEYFVRYTFQHFDETLFSFLTDGTFSFSMTMVAQEVAA